MMESYTFYFAGELFSQKHLLGNAYLAHQIMEQSKGRFCPILPQDLEFREMSPKAIRDQDLLSLIECDLALFHFDGPELDSGTVVEFMTAKFADLPSVVVRTDFRNGGDQAGAGDPWNLMCSFYPRTETVLYSCLESAEQAGHQRNELQSFSSASIEEGLRVQERAVKETAHRIIEAFEQVLALPPVTQNANRESVYQQLADFAGFGEKEGAFRQYLSEVLERKRAKGLL